MSTVYCKLRDPGTTFWDPEGDQKISGPKIHAVKRTNRVRNALAVGSLIEKSKAEYRQEQKDLGASSTEEEEAPQKEEEEEKKEETSYSKSDVEEIFSKARDAELVEKDGKQWIYGEYQLGSSVEKAISSLLNAQDLVAQMEEELK